MGFVLPNWPVMDQGAAQARRTVPARRVALWTSGPPRTRRPAAPTPRRLTSDASGGALRLREGGADLPAHRRPRQAEQTATGAASVRSRASAPRRRWRPRCRPAPRRVGRRRTGGQQARSVAISHMIGPPTICPQTAVDGRTRLASAGPHKIGP
jgi:hypothetical protein